MLKRFKFYLISGIVLVFIVCNFVDKPIAKVGEVKDTVMMKLNTKRVWRKLTGRRFILRKLVRGSLTYAARVWWFFRWI